MDTSDPQNHLNGHQSELDDALKARDALEDILRVINESPGDLAVIFDVILEKALRLCHAPWGVVFLYESGLYEAVCRRGLPKEHDEWFRQTGRFAASPETGLGYIANKQELVHIEDVAAGGVYKSGDPLRVATVELGKARTFLAVPLIVGKDMVGAFTVYRQEVNKFSDSEVALAKTFARNAAIAVEHTQLLARVRDQAKELETLNRDLQSKVSEQVGELERLGRLKRFLSPEVAELIVAPGRGAIL